MAVKLRMKKLGRRHRPFFRICAADVRSPRDGRVIEEIGTYDPMISDTDARVTLNQERVAYWLSVGAQPTEKVAVLIKKYGPEGTHLKQQEEAQARLKARKEAPLPPPPVMPKKEEKAEEPQPEASEEAVAAPAEEAKAEGEETAAEAKAEAAAESAEEASAEEAKEE